MEKPILIDDKRVAYTPVMGDAMGKWVVAICIEHEPGYRPLHDYGPYADEKRCRDIANNLNGKLNVTPKMAAEIVASTFRGARSRVSRPKPRLRG